MSDKIAVLIPTRNRPHRAAQVLASIEQTTATNDVGVIFGVDHDDPSRDVYPEIIPWNKLYIGHGGSFQIMLNELATHAIMGYQYDIIGSVGDDHRFRTKGWDRRVQQVLAHKPGIVYANDQYPTHSLPTNVFMNKEIPETLGYFALPKLQHMYIDNAWKALGEKADCLTYLSDVVIEHLHYSNGKSAFDETYAKTNTDLRMQEDREEYEKWLRDPRGLRQDAEAISGR